jgi:hypothetical protein
MHMICIHNGPPPCCNAVIKVLPMCDLSMDFADTKTTVTPCVFVVLRALQYLVCVVDRWLADGDNPCCMLYYMFM